MKRTATTSTTVREVQQPNSFANAAGTAAAAAAVKEVSRAVRMRGVEAPDVDDKSFIAIRDVMDAEDDAAAKERREAVDEAGLPLVYSKEKIQAYWAKQGGALQSRWVEFLAKAVPFLTKVAGYGLRGGAAMISANDAELARDARRIFQELGPTYVKLGQVLSVRPDVLPPAALAELSILQDSVEPFSTPTAIASIESELGKPLGAVFSSISEEPVAAASLAQVYRAVRADTGEVVAVKVQRPKCLETVSLDLYVLRRAAEVVQVLLDEWIAPLQRTNYVDLLDVWAVGFYTELDFTNEARNQQRISDLLAQEAVSDIYVPKVHHDLCTRRLLVTEWIDGIKLSECPPEEIRELIAIGQACFLTQILSVGLFHADPHPGNLMKMNDTSKGKVALLDFGLVAAVSQQEMDTMVSATIHLANRDYASLVDDFIALQILPDDCNRNIVVPLMDKALTPYLAGGGAKKYEEAIRSSYGIDGTYSGSIGGFQAMTQDMLTVLNQVPFSIPPSFALLGRAIVTLEGIALMGDQDYALIQSAYPWIARKIVREDRPDAERALIGVLYGNGGESLRGRRLSSILNSVLAADAMSGAGKTSSAVIDLEATSAPEDAVSLRESVSFILSPAAKSLRQILEKEVQAVFGLWARTQLRQTMRASFAATLPQAPGFLPGFVKSFVPAQDKLPVPFIVPQLRSAPSSPSSSTSSTSTTSLSSMPSSSKATMATPAVETNVNPLDAVLSSTPVPIISTAPEILEAVAPPLSREEEVYLISASTAVSEVAGTDVMRLFSTSSLISVLSRVTGLSLPQLGASSPSSPDDDARIFDERIEEVSSVLNGLSNDEREQLHLSAAKIVNSTVLDVVKRAQSLLRR